MKRTKDKEENVNLSWISSRNVWIIYDANILNLNYELADIRALIRSLFDDDELMPHEIAPPYNILSRAYVSCVWKLIIISERILIPFASIHSKVQSQFTN